MNVWITGASSGIGRELALLYAESGHTVYASARGESALQALADESAALAGDIVAEPVDVTDNESILRAFKNMQSAGEAPDLVILNAGYYNPVEFDQVDLDHFEKTYDVNLRGVVRCLLPALNLFRQRQQGHIAIVSSVSGYRGLPKAAAYGSSKAALINLAESLKPECNANGIKISLINPGFVKSKLTDRNSFSMPFLMETRPAAKRIVKGLEKDGFEVTFPKRFTYILKLFRILPYRLYFLITKSLLKS